MLDAINAAIASSTAAVEDSVAQNLPEIFVIFGGLVALGIGLRLFKRLVGRKA
jgi:hypothetical protein